MCAVWRKTAHFNIFGLIGKLPNKGSSVFDKIDNIMLKKIKSEVAPQICNIANASMTQGIFPELMKNALVVPLYKAKSRELVTNYKTNISLNHDLEITRKNCIQTSI